MSKVCPMYEFFECRETRCAVWDKRRECCGLITQAPIDSNELVSWLYDRLWMIKQQ